MSLLIILGIVIAIFIKLEKFDQNDSADKYVAVDGKSTSELKTDPDENKIDLEKQKGDEEKKKVVKTIKRRRKADTQTLKSSALFSFCSSIFKSTLIFVWVYQSHVKYEGYGPNIVIYPF